MKKLLLFSLFTLLISMTFVSCSDEDSNPIDNPPSKGSIYLTSNPSGAQIWRNGANTGKVTPDSITGLDAGTYAFVLKAQDYEDATISVTITQGQRKTESVTLLSEQLAFGPIKLWETIGTTTDQPSGLILSTGTASGISGLAPDRLKVDVYYSSSGFVVTSASNSGSMTRVTYFKVGNSSNLNDGNDPSGPKDNNWTDRMNDTETNYVYLYDNDEHYSKIKIVNMGGGTPNNPAWIEIQGIYNKAKNNYNF